ncbi:MAG: hypothetical protein CL678_18065 [Bdellovibrionaceae bacterium]|nr:hypothetical protein [Pseudobdellovibrionaceae bacterium]|tara:strand:- start:1741 stop:3177 length:1437 start_codon:yes stop_codon:yes gene_type:complete
MKTLMLIVFLFSSQSFGEGLSSAEWVKKLKLPDPEIEVLENGLKLAWFSGGRVPTLDMAILFPEGTKNDPDGKSGTHLLLGEAWERSVGTYSHLEFKKKVESLGARSYVSISEDSTTVGIHGLSLDQEILTNLFSKLVLTPLFKKEEVQKVKKRTIEGFIHLGDQSSSLVSWVHSRRMDSQSIYGRGSFESLSEFKKIKSDEIKEYWKNHYGPRGAVLMIVGKYDKDKIKKQLMKNFSKWKMKKNQKKNTKKYSDLSIPDLLSDKVLVIDHPGDTQVQIRMGLKVPTLKNPDSFSLQVANTLIGEMFFSRLNLILRSQKALTYGARSSFEYHLDSASWNIVTATATEKSSETLQTTLDLIKSMNSGEIMDTEIETAKEYLLGSFPLKIATLNAVAARWLSSYLYDLGPRFLTHWMTEIQKVNSSRVKKVVKKYLPYQKLKITISGDGKQIKSILKKSKFKNSFTVLKFKDNKFIRVKQ